MVNEKCKAFKALKHTIILQQLDVNAYPLPGTSIPVVSIYQSGNRVEIQFPKC